MVLSKKQIHVVKTNNGKWAYKKSGAKRASGVFNTQKEAIDAAIDKAKRQGETEVFVHGKDGKIRERNTYGNDPRKSKG